MMTHEQLISFMKESRNTAEDATALNAISLYPHWTVDLSVSVGDRYQYGEVLYRCVQAHTTQADWTPLMTPALWVVVSLEDFPQWVQPTGGHDAYNTGDKVTHKDVKYVSDVDANVWEPGVYGWSVYVE